ncbi:YceI family protein [Occultella gossypii]|uniref:YceI family protein n=1 Tax=Occultella gossypii TaxID=2800820 RepID=A0ABS7SFC6_9MICO|nr:YceI family protein [Occultella gossypii]MBZ2198845.1 YceI family protein [Occultella gossypii]
MSVLDASLSGEWVFDPSHSRVGFSARHAMVTKVRGAFNEVDGRMYVDPDGPQNSTVEVRLAVASVDTRNSQRDDHLRSADFFDVETYPEIVFRSTSVDEVEDDTYMVVGDLSIRDVTKQVAIPITLVGVERDPMGNLRAGFEGTRRVDRRDFGLQWNVPLDTGGVLVSEKITLEFDISAVRTEDAAADGAVAAEGAERVEGAIAPEGAERVEGAEHAGSVAEGAAEPTGPEYAYAQDGDASDAATPAAGVQAIAQSEEIQATEGSPQAPVAPEYDRTRPQPVPAQPPSPWEPPPGHQY